MSSLRYSFGLGMAAAAAVATTASSRDEANAGRGRTGDLLLARGKRAWCHAGKRSGRGIPVRHRGGLERIAAVGRPPAPSPRPSDLRASPKEVAMRAHSFQLVIAALSVILAPAAPRPAFAAWPHDPLVNVRVAPSGFDQGVCAMV